MPAVAVPAAVVQLNVTALPLAAERVTVNVAAVVPAFPSVAETSLTERTGSGSLSVMVATPCASPILPEAPTRLERFTTNVSLASLSASPITGTETTFEAPLLVSETVPEEAVKSAAVAVPEAVAQLTWSPAPGLGAGAAWIVKLALTVLPVPSVTVTSVIVMLDVGAAVAGTGTASRSRPGSHDRSQRASDISVENAHPK